MDQHGLADPVADAAEQAQFIRRRDPAVAGSRQQMVDRGGRRNGITLTRREIDPRDDPAPDRDTLQVAVVGDITAKELGPLLDKVFGDLPEKAPDLPKLPEAKPAM